MAQYTHIKRWCLCKLGCCNDHSVVKLFQGFLLRPFPTERRVVPTAGMFRFSRRLGWRNLRTQDAMSAFAIVDDLIEVPVVVIGATDNCDRNKTYGKCKSTAVGAVIRLNWSRPFVRTHSWLAATPRRTYFVRLMETGSVCCAAEGSRNRFCTRFLCSPPRPRCFFICPYVRPYIYHPSLPAADPSIQSAGRATIPSIHQRDIRYGKGRTPLSASSQSSCVFPPRRISAGFPHRRLQEGSD